MQQVGIPFYSEYNPKKKTSVGVFIQYYTDYRISLSVTTERPESIIFMKLIGSIELFQN